jgi:hypothetical protein
VLTILEVNSLSIDLTIDSEDAQRVYFLNRQECSKNAGIVARVADSDFVLQTFHNLMNLLTVSSLPRSSHGDDIYREMSCELISVLQCC